MEEVELHEDWARLKGHPAYGWFVVSHNPRVIAIHKVEVLGRKRPENRGDEESFEVRWLKKEWSTVGYRTREEYDRQFYRGKTTEAMFRSELCFTRKEIARSLSELRLNHRDRALDNLNRLAHICEDLSKELNGLRETLFLTRYDQVPKSVLDKFT